MTHEVDRTYPGQASRSVVAQADHGCSCGECTAADLPYTPFEALRVAYGMLLGEDDFRVLMGNPRGKQMLHASWLHGSGVVWGLDVCRDGELVLRVTPGLAVDGLGRELALAASGCLDLRGWVEVNAASDDNDGCVRRTVHACLVVEFACTPARPVPTLADPCDVTRAHDEASRVAEGARLELRLGACPPHRTPYHRVRVLLGLDPVGADDPAGEQARAARRQVACLPDDERPAALLRQFRCLAAADAAQLRPAHEAGASGPTLFGVLEADAAVPLACLDLELKDADGCTTIEDVRLDPCCRTVLLPTATISDLLCGLAPGVLGTHAQADAGGPRVLREGAGWSGDGMQCVLPVTKAVQPGSLRRNAVTVTSLSAKGWVDEDITRVWFDAATKTVVVEMADRPVNPLVRVSVAGTGPTPVYGVDPAVPLAGLWGGPPGTTDEGHDAVLSFSNPLSDNGRPGSENESTLGENGAGR